MDHDFNELSGDIRDALLAGYESPDFLLAYEPATTFQKYGLFKDIDINIALESMKLRNTVEGYLQFVTEYKAEIRTGNLEYSYRNRVLFYNEKAETLNQKYGKIVFLLPLELENEVKLGLISHPKILRIINNDSI